MSTYRQHLVFINIHRCNKHIIWINLTGLSHKRFSASSSACISSSDAHIETSSRICIGSRQGARINWRFFNLKPETSSTLSRLDLRTYWVGPLLDWFFLLFAPLLFHFELIFKADSTTKPDTSSGNCSSSSSETCSLIACEVGFCIVMSFSFC